MRELKVTVRDKIATADGQTVVCGNSDYTVHFDLDAEWDAYETKTMRVVNHDRTYTDVVFTGIEAPLPAVVNQSAIRVGLFAGDLHTSTPAYFPCELSILCGTGLPADPTPDIYNQIMTLLNSKDENYTLLEGKSAVFLGDSQTESNYHKTKIWWEWVKDILSLGTCVNYGLSGSTITNNGSSSMSVRYANMSSDADIAFVMGGVNDVWFSQPLGTITDEVDTTFYGAVKLLCRNLKTKYAGKPIVFINCTAENNSSCTHSGGLEANSFAKAMKEACWLEGVLCLDAYGSLGINPKYDTTYTTDGLHLNNKGQELLGKWVAQQIKDNIRYISTIETVAVTGVTLNKTTTTITEGGTETLIATVAPSNATNKAVTWSTSNSAIAKVSNGTITAVADGNATITVTTSDGGFTATCAVTVEEGGGIIAVTGISLNKTTTTIEEGNTETLTATLQPTGATGTITWTSSDASKATVNNGVITAVAAGNATITAACNGYSASCTVTIEEASGVVGKNVTATIKAAEVNTETHLAFLVGVTPNTTHTARVEFDIDENSHLHDCANNPWFYSSIDDFNTWNYAAYHSLVVTFSKNGSHGTSSDVSDTNSYSYWAMVVPFRPTNGYPFTVNLTNVFVYIDDVKTPILAVNTWKDNSDGTYADIVINN